MFIKNTNCYFNVSQSLATLKALTSEQRVAQNSFGVNINELIAIAKRADLNPVLRIEAANSETVEYELVGYKPVENGFVLAFLGSEDIFTLTAYVTTKNYGCSFDKIGSKVEVIRNITEPGVPIANIKVDGVSNMLYAPENVFAYVNITPLLDELLGAGTDTILIHKEDLSAVQKGIVDMLRNCSEELYESGASTDAYRLIHNYKFFADDGDYEIGGFSGAVTEQYDPCFAKYGNYTDSETSDEMREWHIGFYNQLPDSTTGGKNARWYTQFSIVSNLTSGDDDYDITITKMLAENEVVHTYDVTTSNDSLGAAFADVFTDVNPEELDEDSVLTIKFVDDSNPSSISSQTMVCLFNSIETTSNDDVVKYVFTNSRADGLGSGHINYLAVYYKVNNELVLQRFEAEVSSYEVDTNTSAVTGTQTDIYDVTAIPLAVGSKVTLKY